MACSRTRLGPSVAAVPPKTSLDLVICVFQTAIKHWFSLGSSRTCALKRSSGEDIAHTSSAKGQEATRFGFKLHKGSQGMHRIRSGGYQQGKLQRMKNLLEGAQTVRATEMAEEGAGDPWQRGREETASSGAVESGAGH